MVAELVLQVFHSKPHFKAKDKAFVWLPGNGSDKHRQLTQQYADLDVLIGNRTDEQRKYVRAYCLFVVWANSPKDSSRKLVGLLLSRLALGRGLYRRIGRFEIEQPECEGLLEEIKSRYSLAKDDYLERAADGSYTITIL